MSPALQEVALANFAVQSIIRKILMNLPTFMIAKMVYGQTVQGHTSVQQVRPIIRHQISPVSNL